MRSQPPDKGGLGASGDQVPLLEVESKDLHWEMLDARWSNGGFGSGSLGSP